MSALANTRDGYLLLGVKTTQNPTHKSEEVTSVSCFPQSLCDLDQYRKILLEFIYPPVRGIDIDWFSSSANPFEGIVAIHVTKAGCGDQPYLVSQVLLEGVASGKLFGYFQRVEDDAEPMRLQELRERLKDGMRNRDTNRRLENIETILARQTSESTPKKNEYPLEKLLQRAAYARQAGGMGEYPTVNLVACPLDGIILSTLFESKQSAEAKLLENPPKDRSFGFDLETRGRTEIVDAELLRRTTAGRKGMDLYRDGTLIFVGRGDDSFLGWVCRSGENELLINNIALTEVVYLFFRFSIEILKLAKPVPTEVKILFQLLRPPNDDRVFKLGNANFSAEWISDHGYSEAPNPGRIISTSFELQGAVPEVEAFRLLKNVFNLFGFTDAEIPYVDRQSSPARIDPRLFVRRN